MLPCRDSERCELTSHHVDYPQVCFDDLYTPGSFWLSPCQPRDAAGHRCDPDSGRLVGATGGAADELETEEVATAGPAGPADWRDNPPEEEEDSVRRILGDMAPAPPRARRR
jgi:hypothetical protein